MKNRRGRTERPELSEVAPGIWRLPRELPGHSVGHVNVYGLFDDDGITLVDAGWGIPGAWDTLDEQMKQLGASADDVTRIVITHFHPDHCGLAGAFQTRHRVPIGMHRADARHLNDRFFERKPFREETARWLTEAGAPTEVVDSGLRFVEEVEGRVAPLVPDLLLDDGDVIRTGRWELHAMHTPGHTPGHVCFYEPNAKVLFSGDHMLQHINTSPAYRPQSTPNPVSDYLATLDSLGSLEVDLVLPGHQDPFTDHRGRIEELRGHHAERIELTQGLVARGSRTVWTVTREIPRSRVWDRLSHAAMISAVGETFGHLVHLAASGTIQRTGDRPIRWAVT